jgi:hypothetical protein
MALWDYSPEGMHSCCTLSGFIFDQVIHFCNHHVVPKIVEPDTVEPKLGLILSLKQTSLKRTIAAYARG